MMKLLLLLLLLWGFVQALTKYAQQTAMSSVVCIFMTPTECTEQGLQAVA